MKVELLEQFGDDLMVANTARVSYGKHSEVLDEARDGKLINYLAKHGHTSPFRHPQLRFRIQCAIFVERQIFKHAIGVSTNSRSGRYVDFSDEYDVPTQLRFQSSNSKQGSGDDLPAELNDPLVAEMQAHVEASAALYAKLCAAGVAKEQCRTILPLCLETTFIWTGSLQAFTHLCHLRLKPDAQKETRDVVAEMLAQVKAGGKFPLSLAAFGL